MPLTRPRPLVFLDVETTGLDARCHEPWEFGLVRVDRSTDPDHPDVVRAHGYIDVDLGEADPEALAIGRFYERHPAATGRGTVLTREAAAIELHTLLDRAILIAANPSFDERMVTRLLYRNGLDPNWHYRPVCVETLAAGFLLGLNADGPAQVLAGTIRLPWHHGTLAEAIDLDPDDYDRHTALGDAIYARAMWDRIVGIHADLVLPDEPIAGAEGVEPNRGGVPCA